MIALLSTDFPLLIKALYIVYLSLGERNKRDKGKEKEGFERKKGAGKNLHLRESKYDKMK